jgi:GTP pyrophosphokinase
MNITLTHRDQDSQARIDSAIEFATIKHAGQFRKYTGNEYITHPITVAHIVSHYTDDADMIIAAILHDVQEDCDVTNDELKELFGDDVSYMVEGLTHTYIGNRAQRKHETNLKLQAYDNRVKTIKIADNLHNLGSVMKYDEKFAMTFVKEAITMRESLHGGDAILMGKLTAVLESARIRFNIT